MLLFVTDGDDDDDDDDDDLTNNTVCLHKLPITRRDRWDEIISPKLQSRQITDLSINYNLNANHFGRFSNFGI